MFTVKVVNHPTIKDIKVYSNGFIFNCKINRFLSNSMTTKGYYTVSVFGSDISVHKLVVEAFIGKIPEGMEVNHIDGIKTNNDISNLEICTRSENMIHAHSNGLCRKKAKGEKHGMSTISDETRSKMMDMINRGGVSLKDISIALNISVNIVYHASRDLKSQCQI